MKSGFSLARTLAAGLVASGAMVMFLIMSPAIWGANIDVVALFSTFSTKYGVWVPWAQFFVLSVVVFPVIYSLLLYRDLPGPPWMKGLIWGIILFVLRGVVVMPVMGWGFFASGVEPTNKLMTELITAHCVYGFMLGVLAGKQNTRASTRAGQKQPDERAKVR